jgi:hypothetical protein
MCKHFLLGVCVFFFSSKDSVKKIRFSRFESNNKGTTSETPTTALDIGDAIVVLVEIAMSTSSPRFFLCFLVS